MLEHLDRVQASIPITQLLNSLGRLEGATAAAANMIPPKHGPLGAGINLQHFPHGRLRLQNTTVRIHNNGSGREKLLNLTKDLDEPIDFLGRVIDVKTGAGGGFDTELVH